MNDLQLRCFMVAAEYENFTKAAEQLYISQPVIGRHISHLEEELGFNLFDRERKSVRLSENGRIFLEFLKESEERFNEAMAKIEGNLRSNSMDLSIGTAEGQRLLYTYPDLFQRLLGHDPELKVIISYFMNFGLTEALKNGSIDLAVINLEDIRPFQDQMRYRVLKKLKGGLIIPAGHPAAHKENLEPSDFENDSFILLSEKDSKVATDLQKKTIKSLGMSKVIEAPNISTLSLWAEAGFGITSIVESHKLCYSPNLVFREHWSIHDTYEVVAWRKHNNNPAIRVFCDLLDELGFKSEEESANTEE